LLRYISGPVLAIIFSFAFPEFHSLRYDPMMITGFILSILTIVVVLVGFVMPRYYDAFVPVERRGEGMEKTTAMEVKGEVDGMEVGRVVDAEGGLGGGLGRRSSSGGEEKGMERDGVPDYRADGMRV
jgi:solute carrier family 6 GABA transporter-like protein 1